MSEKEQEKILRAVSRGLKLKKTFSFSAAFVGSPVIKRLNRIYRGKNETTDVLSFPFKDKTTVGEILICSARAKKQAREFRHSFETEATILLVHGLIHLFGYDHLKEKEAKKMFTLQKRILKTLGIEWSVPEVG